MAAKRPNLKIDVSADTSKLSKGMKESKAAVKDFESASSGALSKLGSMFGVNVDSVNKLMSATKGMGMKMAESGNAGVAAMGKLVGSVGGVTTAIAGIGIAGLIASFKLLNDEAQNFKNTVQGASIDLKTNAYIDVYSQTMHDYNSATGKWAAETGANLKKSFKTTWQDIKSTAVNAMHSIATEGLTQKGIGSHFSEAWARTKVASVAATGKASEAERLAQELYDLQRQLSDKTVEWAIAENEIAENKRIAYDKTRPLVEQQAALAKAQELVKKRFTEELELRGQIADKVAAMNDLASSSPEEIDKANQLRVESLRLSKAKDDALRELLERQLSIGAALEKQVEDEKEIARLHEEAQKSRQALIDNPLESVDSSWLPQLLDVPESDAGIIIPVHIDPAPVEAEFLNLSNLLQTGAEIMADSFGQLIGDIMSGGDAWANFGDTALRSLGGLAVQVGKLAIGTGVAALGIKEALMLSPWAAIAAGAALVALGTAVSVGLSNMASGGYSAGASVAQSSFTPSEERRGQSGTQHMDVRVTGTLQASGSSLVAVLNNEKERLYHTT